MNMAFSENKFSIFQHCFVNTFTFELQSLFELKFEHDACLHV